MTLASFPGCPSRFYTFILLFFSPNLIFILIFLLLLFSKENMAITVALGKGIPVNFLLIFLLHEPSTSNN